MLELEETLHEETSKRCAWCHVEIRLESESEREEMCDKCFRSMVKERLQVIVPCDDYASER